MENNNNNNESIYFDLHPINNLSCSERHKKQLVTIVNSMILLKYKIWQFNEYRVNQISDDIIIECEYYFSENNKDIFVVNKSDLIEPKTNLFLFRESWLRLNTQNNIILQCIKITPTKEEEEKEKEKQDKKRKLIY